VKIEHTNIEFEHHADAHEPTDAASAEHPVPDKFEGLRQQLEDSFAEFERKAAEK
jgi:hypothetical protein